ncbi:MAG: DUF2125 domain-containing protein, partial [Pseudomonadota bacterium]
AEGSLSVDPSGYLTGELDASLRNPAELAEILAARGEIPADAVEGVRASITLMSVAAGGEGTEFNGALVFEDGEARIGPLRLLALGPLF